MCTKKIPQEIIILFHQRRTILRYLFISLISLISLILLNLLNSFNWLNWLNGLNRAKRNNWCSGKWKKKFAEEIETDKLELLTLEMFYRDCRETEEKKTWNVWRVRRRGSVTVSLSLSRLNYKTSNARKLRYNCQCNDSVTSL